MSIGCLINLTSEDGGGWEARLYIHDAGFPSDILKLLQKAISKYFGKNDPYYKVSHIIPMSEGDERKISTWQIKRAGKVASALCATWPLSVQPTTYDYPDLLTDFYYDIDISKDGTWFVEVAEDARGAYLKPKKRKIFSGTFEEFSGWIQERSS